MFKENLMAALKDAVGRYNAGVSDSDAVVKAAEAHSFNPEQTQRLVEVYNTAKTICFFKTAADRTGQFTTADGGEVAKRLFAFAPSGGKASGFELHDYGCYDREPMEYLVSGEETVLPEMKTASAPMNEHQLDAALREIESIEQAAVKCAQTAEMCDLRRGDLVNAIVSRVSGLGKQAEAVACLRMLKGSDFDSQVLDVLERRLGADENAVSDIRFLDFRGEQDIVDMYKEACGLHVNCGMFTAAGMEFSKTADAYRKHIFAVSPEESSGLAEFFSADVRDMIVKSGQTTQQNPQQTPSGPPPPRAAQRPAAGRPAGGKPVSVQDELTKALVKSVGGLGKDVVQDVAGALEGGEYERESAKLTELARNYQRKFIIEDLMKNDKILSGVPRENIEAAYETLLQIAPEVSLNKEVVRSVLRSTTNAAAVSPYDAKTLVDLDAAIRSQLEQQGGKAPARAGTRRA